MTLELEGGGRSLEAPQLIVVPAMSIHGFHFSPDTQGHIITLSRPLVERLQARLDSQSGVLSNPDAHALGTTRHHGASLPWSSRSTTSIAIPPWGARTCWKPGGSADHRDGTTGRDGRSQPSRARPRQRDKAREHLQAYQTLIEAQFSQQPGIEHFAEQLGVTSAHLNTLCRRLAGRSALQLLHERLLLEAKRQLTYTNLTIGEVAEGLGFSEPAYFTRFFKRLTGLPPKDFRRRQEADAAGRRQQ